MDGITHWQRSCETKRRYDVEQEEDKTFYSYRCRYCNGWHLATKGKERGLARTAEGYPIVPPHTEAQ